jgi:hypothetical protein
VPVSLARDLILNMLPVCTAQIQNTDERTFLQVVCQRFASLINEDFGSRVCVALLPYISSVFPLARDHV